jgi:predicted transcriptional regulator
MILPSHLRQKAVLRSQLISSPRSKLFLAMLRAISISSVRWYTHEEPDLSVPRRRFTIAHELAHVVIGQTGPNAPRAGKEPERLCDLIAVELLMPAQIFRAQLPVVLHIADIVSLAKRFQTSLAATAHRCAELSRSTLFEVAQEKAHLVLWAAAKIVRFEGRRLNTAHQKGFCGRVRANRALPER